MNVHLGTPACLFAATLSQQRQHKKQNLNLLQEQAGKEGGKAADSLHLDAESHHEGTLGP